MDHFMKMRKKVSMAESTRQVLNKCIELIHRVKGGKINTEEGKEEVAHVLSGYFIEKSGSSGDISESDKLKLEIFIKRAQEVIDRVSTGMCQTHDGIMFMNKIVAFRGEDYPGEEEDFETPVSEPAVQLRPTKPGSKVHHIPTDREQSIVDLHEDKKLKVLDGVASKTLERDLPHPQLERTRTQEESTALGEEIAEEMHDVAEDEEGMIQRMREEIKKDLKRREELEQKPKRYVEEVVRSRVDTSTAKSDEVVDLLDEVMESKRRLETSIIHLNQSLQRHGFELKPIEPK